MIQIISFKTLPLGSSSRPRCEGIGALKHYIAHASKHMPYRAVTGALKHRIVAGALKHRSWSQTLTDNAVNAYSYSWFWCGSRYQCNFQTLF